MKAGLGGYLKGPKHGCPNLKDTVRCQLYGPRGDPSDTP